MTRCKLERMRRYDPSKKMPEDFLEVFIGAFDKTAEVIYVSIKCP